MRHSDRRRISRRDFFKAAGLTVATLAALGGGAYALQRWDDSQNAVSVADTGPGKDHREAAQLKELTYKGKTYRQRPELETYLFTFLSINAIKRERRTSSTLSSASS